ncbi:hypothetical protein EDD85DRAFT_835949 [Armillaria nabsnona]|nr:hypothetical protein EDD85DRAFT_835949 [Armillaria nabsnona]
MLNNQTWSRMTGSGTPFVVQPSSCLDLADGRSCRAAADIIALPRGLKEPALHVDSHLQLVFVRPRSMTVRTDDNKAAARFGIDAVVCPHEGARSFAVKEAITLLLIPSPVHERQPEPRAASDGYTIDTKGTVDTPATTPEIFGRGRAPSFIAALFPLRRLPPFLACCFLRCPIWTEGPTTSCQMARVSITDEPWGYLKTPSLANILVHARMLTKGFTVLINLINNPVDIIGAHDISHRKSRCFLDANVPKRRFQSRPPWNWAA